MDCVDILIRDHEKVQTMYREYSSISDVARKQELVDLMIKEISQHAMIEESMVYPKLKERVPNGSVLSEEAYMETNQVERLLDQLQQMKVADNEVEYDSMMKTMMTDLMAHIKHEEEQFLPLLRQHMYPNELIQLGQQIESSRPLMPTRPHPNAPKEGIAGIAAGLAAAPLDRAQDAIRSTLSAGCSSIHKIKATVSNLKELKR